MGEKQRALRAGSSRAMANAMIQIVFRVLRIPRVPVLALVPNDEKMMAFNGELEVGRFRGNVG